MVDATHQFDELTHFCVRCGCARSDFIFGIRPYCDMVGNVSGISHILAYKWNMEHDHSLVVSSLGVI